MSSTEEDIFLFYGMPGLRLEGASQCMELGKNYNNISTLPTLPSINLSLIALPIKVFDIDTSSKAVLVNFCLLLACLLPCP
ncbi:MULTISPECIES: hypothetical protein [Moorena]|uniref:hypothetical protein n=1 Tax=Moorena TaxID=1155738 RepID=UPI0002DFF784|nr:MULTISPECIES: hypothetical protein [Moorena]NEP34427.1 hypothetical protein [Moorena sp. SIO3B2]NEP69331.1 hypothetical protein [Moorena sp. SIO3A5]NER85957.1 hypothetical protein [Moorena sp. SIO3A2]NES44387.1 hypothetical protein [Moorena sp. SIO2C4]